LKSKKLEDAMTNANAISIREFEVRKV